MQRIAEGRSYRQIAQELGVSKSAVHDELLRHLGPKTFDELVPSPAKPGGPRKLPEKIARIVIRSIVSGESKTAEAAAGMISSTHGISVTGATVRNTLKRHRVRAIEKASKPRLSAKNVKDRMQWAKDHQHWTIDDWKRVVWSDETKICRFSSDVRSWAWIREDCHMEPHHVKQTVKHGSGSIMIWGCMTYNGGAFMCKIDGRMNGEFYRSILQDELQQTIEHYELDPETVVFQHDNDPKHTCKMVKTYLADQPYSVLPWPASSPDLNPIEHLWVYLKKQLLAYPRPPAGILELWDRVQVEWEKIPAAWCSELIDSMPRRVRAVLKAKGHWTKYSAPPPYLSGPAALSHFSTVLPCPAAPSGTLSSLYLPSFSTNLVSGADLQDGGVHQFTPACQWVTHCTEASTGRHLATFTRQLGSSLYTLTTPSPPVAESGRVAASGQVFAAASRSGPESAPCSCRLLSHETLLWLHRLGHPSLLRLRGMASRFLVSGLPRSLPPLPQGPGPACVPCVDACPPSESWSGPASSFVDWAASMGWSESLTSSASPVTHVLQRFGFTYSSPQATPLPTRHSLSALPSDESVESSGPYPELVGCLMYLMTCTRPDLAYPLSILARYVAPGRHRLEHMAATKRVLRYLCSTSGMGLVLGGRSPVVLTGHADASWADDQATQRSSQGYTFSLGSSSVSWRATRSSSVLGSSCEAEIYAGAMAAQELRWLTYLLTDLGEPPRSPPVLYVDNKAMLALCREQRLEHRTKHIALRYFLARELQQRGQLRLAYVASEANTADVFTTALAPYASWVDDLATQRSSQGYTFSLGSGSVSWRSTRSSSVLSSSCEAEIYTGAMAAQELRWLTYLLTDLGEPPRSPLVLYIDNKAMLALCREHILEHRTKHIALRYFLARELQQRGQLRLAYVASQANTADIFTKVLQPCDHQRFCTMLGLVPSWPHLLTS
ncbi:unnamed protein product [Closterium sp. NIES-54]